MYFRSEFEKLKTGLDESKVRKLQLDFVIRLIDKLNEKMIDDEELVRLFENLLRTAVDYSEGREPNLRYYRKQKNDITNYVLKKYSLAYKGYYTAVYMSLGLVFGAALGTVFMTTLNPGFYALGIGPGIALGVAIGAGKEASMEKEGNIY